MATKKIRDSRMAAIEFNYGGATYIVQGFFKNSGKTINEKIYRLMERDLSDRGDLCYNKSISQNNLTVGDSKEDL